MSLFAENLDQWGEIKKRYLVAIIDGYSRIAYAEVMEDIKSLTIMFAALRILHAFDAMHDIKFERIISVTVRSSEGLNRPKQGINPFCRLLDEMGIKHTKAKPYKPQTNGKIERYWHTLSMRS